MSAPAEPRYPVILQVLPALDRGGVERGTVEIAEAIARGGGAALVASAGGRLAGAVERAGGRNIALKLASKNPARILLNAGTLADLIRREAVDIVHARSRAPAWSAWLAARRTGARFVTTYHGTYNEDLPLKRRYNAVMARGEIVIAISHHIAAMIAERHLVPPERIRIIPRGVDPAVFDPEAVNPARLIALAGKWRLPDGAPTIALPGRLTRWKGQTVLIEALARMRHTEAVCVLVGSDQGRARYTRELLALAATRGVAGRVHLVGDCEDMPAAYMMSDVVVNASTDPEGFGRVVIEAQAMARPVIASDHGGAVETIDHDVTGWRVPPGDPAALAMALDYVLDLSKAERAAVGGDARASVSARYTVAAMQALTLDVYGELLASPRTGAEKA